MTNIKNDIPIYAEEQIIQQKIKIPTNFIELKTVGKNYICSTQGWPKEPVCERYGFSANGKWIQLDITQQLMTKLELELGQEITYPLYISPSILKQTPDEFGGITINNEKDIICQKEGIILVQEKAVQVDFTSGEINDLKQKLKKSEELSQETQQLLEKVLKDNEEKHIAIIFFEQQIKDLTQRITELRHDLEQEMLAKKREESKNRELERKIKKLKEDEQVLNSLQTRISDVQNELAGERLIRERIEQDLQTRTEERDARPNITQGQYGNEILEYLRKIHSLERKIKRLDDNIKLLEELAEGELNENQDTINQLTIQRNNLNRQLIAANTLITNTQNLLGINSFNNLPQVLQGETLNSLLARPTVADLQAEQNRANDLEREKELLIRERNDMQTQRNNRPDITLAQWNNDYSRRPTQQQLTNLQRELEGTKKQLEASIRLEKYYHDQIYNHTCPSTVCSRKHCDSFCRSYCDKCKNTIHKEVSYRRVNRDDPEKE